MVRVPEDTRLNSEAPVTRRLPFTCTFPEKVDVPVESTLRDWSMPFTLFGCMKPDVEVGVIQGTVVVAPKDTNGANNIIASNNFFIVFL